MRVTIKTGKGRLPIFIAIPTVLLTGPLSLPIARALRKRAAQDEDLSDAEVCTLARGVRKSAKALRKAKLPLMEIYAVNGERIAVRL